MLITEYITSNWILILVLLGFAISLISTVFMDRKILNSMYLLIVECFILSIVVFAEFKIVSPGPYDTLRLSLMAIRYTSTPLILAQV
ncbi:MAG: hypothetical protein K5745_04030, partial [Saccharofermentans sp.]|nr:hypothetical protein [Saccharofermentans sp.]